MLVNLWCAVIWCVMARNSDTWRDMIEMWTINLLSVVVYCLITISSTTTSTLASCMGHSVSQCSMNRKILRNQGRKSLLSRKWFLITDNFLFYNTTTMQDQDDDMASQSQANTQASTQRQKKQLTLKHGVTMRVRTVYMLWSSGICHLNASLNVINNSRLCTVYIHLYQESHPDRKVQNHGKSQ